MPIWAKADGKRRALLRFQSGAVPMAAIGCSLIRALKEFKQSPVGIGRLANGLVGQNELAEVGIEAGLRRRDGVLRVSVRLRVGVAVEEWLD